MQRAIHTNRVVAVEKRHSLLSAPRACEAALLQIGEAAMQGFLRAEGTLAPAGILGQALLAARAGHRGQQPHRGGRVAQRGRAAALRLAQQHALLVCTLALPHLGLSMQHLTRLNGAGT